MSKHDLVTTLLNGLKKLIELEVECIKYFGLAPKCYECRACQAVLEALAAISTAEVNRDHQD